MIGLLKSAENHQFYNKILKHYIPELPKKDYNNPAFIGLGHSEGNLNAYRRINIKEEFLFEKIYITQKKPISTILWWEKNFKSLIKEEINFSEIKYLFKSQHITAVYFQYIDLPHPSRKEALEQALNIAHILYQISLGKEVKEIINKAPDFLMDFRRLGTINKKEYEAQNELRSLKIDIENLLKKINESKKVFSHGDLKRTNLMIDNTVLDWDSSGIYPLGLDYAFIYFQHILIESEEAIKPDLWLEKHVRKTILESDWKDFKINFAYFSYVFLMDLKNSQEKTKKIKLQLCNFLRQKSTTI